MIETWFTSDSHFGHKNILEYEKESRPFATLDEMHEVMIDRWNTVVGTNDVVYHLGDFCFGRKNLSIAARLNGKKKLIMGNHDTYPTADYLQYFDKLYGCVFWNRCILSHMPVHSNGLGARWLLNVHGHLHSRVVKKPYDVMYEDHNVWKDPQALGVIVYNPEPVIDLNYFNVSVEQNNLTPFHADEIRARLKLL